MAEQLQIKSLEEIRDDYLRTYRNSLIKRGIPNPNVAEGTEIHLRASSLAQQIFTATAGLPAAADAQMADTAQGADLVRYARAFGLSLRPAGKSAGPLVVDLSIAGPVGIPIGAQLIDPAGLAYEIIMGGPTVDGGTVQIRSVDTGAATNLPAGTVLRWTAPPAFVEPTATVGLGGLRNGVDAESIEGLRARLLERLAHPPNGSNWPTLTAAAEDGSTAVAKAFAYPAANGPSTAHVAVVAAPTLTYKGREVGSIFMTTEVTPAVLAAMHEYAEIVTTTVENVEVNVSFALQLPAAKTASPGGPGGGWSDGVPFPVRSSVGYVVPDAISSSTEFTITADSAPVVGGKVCWISRDDWKLRTASIVSFTGSGPWTITIDIPFTSDNGVAIGLTDYVFPGAERMDIYVSTALATFAALGPGQKTSSPGLLPRAYRRPLVAQAWPSDVGRGFLKTLVASGDEVIDADFLYRSIITPALPALITDPPKILVPGRLGFYPLE